jgi:hypothetical protein
VGCRRNPRLDKILCFCGILVLRVEERRKRQKTTTDSAVVFCVGGVFDFFVVPRAVG